VLEPRGEHPFGCDQECRARAEAPFEADLPSNLVADSPSPFVGDALRDRARGHTPWLQEDQRTATIIVDERRRNPCGLACAGLRRDDDGARSSKVFDDLADEWIDWKWFVRQ
jgi:hypothetical protein